MRIWLCPLAFFIVCTGVGAQDDLPAARKVLTGHKEAITCLEFSPDGNTLATGSKDGDARLWDTATWKTRVTLPGHKDMVTTVAFSPDSALVATGSHDPEIKLWNAANGKETCVLKGHRNEVRGLAFLSDAALASASADYSMKTWI